MLFSSSCASAVHRTHSLAEIFQKMIDGWKSRPDARTVPPFRCIYHCRLTEFFSSPGSPSTLSHRHATTSSHSSATVSAIPLRLVWCGVWAPMCSLSILSPNVLMCVFCVTLPSQHVSAIDFRPWISKLNYWLPDALIIDLSIWPNDILSATICRTSSAECC